MVGLNYPKLPGGGFYCGIAFRFWGYVLPVVVGLFWLGAVVVLVFGVGVFVGLVVAFWA